MAFVLLPCDLPTWPTVSKFLQFFKDVKSASQFCKIFHELHEYCNVGINLGSFETTPKDYFTGLENFLCLDSDESQFFSLTLPVMVDLALNIKDFRPPQGLQYFLQQEGREVSLPRKFVASMLAHIFFCTMPRRTRNSHPTLTDPCLAPLLSSLQRESQCMKLKAFLNYFRLLAIHEAKGDVTFSRKVKDLSSLFLLSEWSSSAEKLCSFVLKSEGRIQEGIHENAILACFASSDITRSTLTGWNSQQVETMISFPEILVAAVLAEHLEDNEVFQVSGTLRVADIKCLKTDPSCVLLDSFEIPDILHNVADAQNYSGDPSAQYKMANLLRELNKAFVGFSSVTLLPTDDVHSSSSDFISVSRQHSDEEDSGVPRDRIFSSEENNETLDEKNRRIKSLFHRGFNQQARHPKEKRQLSVNDYESMESEDKVFQVHRVSSSNPSDLSHLIKSSDLLKNSSIVEEKRGDFAESRRINSSVSYEGIKSMNRNIHRKRKKKRRSKNSFEQYLSTEVHNEAEKHENVEEHEKKGKLPAHKDENIEKSRHSGETNLDDKNKDLLLLSTYRRITFRESSGASTKDSDYLTADLKESGMGVSHTKEASSIAKDKDAKLLMDRMIKAIKNIEAEKGDTHITTSNEECLKESSQEITSSHASNFEVTTQQSKDTTRIHDKEKTTFNIQDKKVIQKPPLPKTPKSKMASVPVSRKRQSSEENVVSVHPSSLQDRSFSTADEDIYFSAFESLELQDAVKSSVKYAKKKTSKRAKEREVRRKRSFAQRLRETLTRGHSTDSTAKEDDTHVQINGEKSNKLRCTDDRNTSNLPKPSSQHAVVRKLSGEVSFENEESLEPFSNRFHNEQLRCLETMDERALGAFETASEGSESNSTTRDDSDDSNDSVSSRYSFSSDYSSDLNEVYEHVEEMLQPLNDKVIGPRRLAVKRFCRSILKRALSDTYKGVIFSLNGLSCLCGKPGSSRTLSLVLSENPSKTLEYNEEVKLLQKKQKKDTFVKRENWNKIVTGNWGCGRLNGDPQIKVMLQWAAASQARGSVFYFYTFGKETLARLYEVMAKIQSMGWTVGDLIQSVLDFSQVRHASGIRKDSQILQCEERRSSCPQSVQSLFDYYLNSELKKF